MQGINEYNQIHINSLNTICEYQNLRLILSQKFKKSHIKLS